MADQCTPLGRGKVDVQECPHSSTGRTIARMDLSRVLDETKFRKMVPLIERLVWPPPVAKLEIKEEIIEICDNQECKFPIKEVDKSEIKEETIEIWDNQEYKFPIKEETLYEQDLLADNQVSEMAIKSEVKEEEQWDSQEHEFPFEQEAAEEEDPLALNSEDFINKVVKNEGKEEEEVKDEAQEKECEFFLEQKEKDDSAANYSTNNIQQLKLYLSTHTEVNPDSSKVCKETNSRDKLYQCTECGETFVQSLALKIHVTTHARMNKNEYKASRSRNRRDRVREKRYSCGDCDYKTEHISQLERHIQTKHSDEKSHSCTSDYRTPDNHRADTNIQAINTRESTNNCAVCEFGAKWQLYVQGLHGKDKDISYSCMKCENAKAHSSFLKSFSHARNSLDKPYNCSQCTYSTTNSGDLKTHIQDIHTGEKPHCCAQCEFKTTRSGYLKAHIQAKHSSEKTFECTQCRTAYGSLFTNHFRAKRTGEKPYSCTECVFKTTRNGHLKAHIRSKHSSGKHNSCTHCNYGTTRSRNLKRHFKAKHNK